MSYIKMSKLGPHIPHFPPLSVPAGQQPCVCLSVCFSLGLVPVTVIRSETKKPARQITSNRDY